MAGDRGPKKGLPPLLPVIILSFLNLIAALALFYFVGKSYAVRLGPDGWVQHLDKRKAERDGLTTEALLTTLTTSERQKVDAWKSEFRRRKGWAEQRLEPLRDQQAKIGTPDSDKVAKDVGDLDMSEILHEYIKLHTPRLRSEEQNLSAERDALLSIKRKYKLQIDRLNEEIKTQEKTLKGEKELTDKVVAENLERRKELAELYSELEEAVAARSVAEGREKDMKDLLARTRQHYKDLVKENQGLLDEIIRMEGIAVEPVQPDKVEPGQGK